MHRDRINPQSMPSFHPVLHMLANFLKYGSIPPGHVTASTKKDEGPYSEHHTSGDHPGSPPKSPWFFAFWVLLAVALLTIGGILLYFKPKG
ncbi:hypothetical protein lerEdw1_004212 [Lerista edwardsae]|nr:hypothetical protein lerEdw1_004212 [Lerista edwardsae]